MMMVMVMVILMMMMTMMIYAFELANLVFLGVCFIVRTFFAGVQIGGAS